MNLTRDILESDLRSRISMNIREAIEVAGLTQREVASLAGMSERQLRRILAGEKLGLDTLAPVARALGLDVSVFVAPRHAGPAAEVGHDGASGA